jgi:hypothetical protein
MQRSESAETKQEQLSCSPLGESDRPVRRAPSRISAIGMSPTRSPPPPRAGGRMRSSGTCAVSAHSETFGSSSRMPVLPRIQGRAQSASPVTNGVVSRDRLSLTAAAEVVRRRRMVRNYADDPVDSAVVERALEHATRAPSAGFSQGGSSSYSTPRRTYGASERPRPTRWTPPTAGSPG